MNAPDITSTAAPPVLPRSGPHINILLVEDSVEDAELLQFGLRDAPFTFSAHRVETEEEYVAALAGTPVGGSAGALPDLILCDYHLPRFSANRALEILTGRGLDIPFIMVSHHIGEDAAVAAMHNGADDYLLKNRLGRLPRAIEAALERRTARRQKADAEKALQTSEAMKRGILNSLSTRIAVIDGSGVIVATNKAWESFGDVRSTFYKSPATLGTNYIDLLREGAARGDEPAIRGLHDVLSVIHREAAFTSLEYELALPGGTRWFVARAMPLEDSTDGAVISHEDVTDRMLAHLALRDSNKRLQVVSKRLLSIQEDERRGISRELHDDIGQSLTAMKIGLHRLAQRVPDDCRVLLGECLGTADSTLDKLRNLSLELRPPQLDQLGLQDALGWLVDRQRSTTGMSIDYQCVGVQERLPNDLEIVCYRIAQEALNNAARHASASNVSLRLEIADRLLKLSIRDDGAGFDMDAVRTKAVKSGSLGLISMDERAQLVGGRLKIRSVPGEGTGIQVTFVLERPESAAEGPGGR